MKQILSDSLIWLSLLAALCFLAFLFRGLKTVRWRIFARLFICLSCLCAALILSPRGTSLIFIQFIAALIVIAAGLIMLIDILLGFLLRTKQTVLPGKKMYLSRYPNTLWKSVRLWRFWQAKG